MSSITTTSARDRATQTRPDHQEVWDTTPALLFRMLRHDGIVRQRLSDRLDEKPRVLESPRVRLDRPVLAVERHLDAVAVKGGLDTARYLGRSDRGGMSRRDTDRRVLPLKRERKHSTFDPGSAAWNAVASEGLDRPSLLGDALGEVSHRDYPHNGVFIHHRQMPEPTEEHLIQCLGHRGVGPDRHRISGHPLRDR